MEVQKYLRSYRAKKNKKFKKAVEKIALDMFINAMKELDKTQRKL